MPVSRRGSWVDPPGLRWGCPGRRLAFAGDDGTGVDALVETGVVGRPGARRLGGPALT
ncbi:hypothetical protein HMPREF9062_1663 [Actinomyces sp. oral taxon 448 str. F0400]|nr:hypothetical protein HMPREF9062_1663 [Actinomyces sp. oral taxon 448 str. F0400]